MPSETWIFVFGIAAAFVLFFVTGLFGHKLAVQGPAILTMLGILGTFWGVAEGLLRFDPQNIKEGLPTLLGGLKTAFYASIAGVFGAIILKMLLPWIGAPFAKRTSAPQDATAGDIVQALNDLKSVVGGEGESTLISQIKLMRQDTNDRLDSLQKAQTEALSKLSEMGSATLVEALKQVIFDFNQKITEQFGDNFKQLNQAVGKLLEWQDQYMKHVDSTSENLGHLISQSSSIVENQTEITAKSERFAEVSEGLAHMLEGLETQKSQMLETISSLGRVFEKSADALPALELRIVEVANQMASASKQSQDILTSSIKDSSSALSKNLEALVAETSRSHAEHSRKIAEQVDKSKQQIELLDAALAEELTKSLNSLGRQLASLSEKFVSDYTPLTERLREVVRLSKAVTQ
jgi:ABC-type transporter Mla subunit MlaD